MRNGRVVLFGILCILFVISAAFGQEQSDSHIITVTKKIDVAKLNENVEDLNKNVKTLTDTLGKLNKNVETLTTTVTKLEERTGIILNLQYIILAGILGGPLVTFLVYKKRFGKDNEGANTVDRLTEQIAKLTSAQAEISETRDVSRDPKVPNVEGLDELTDNRRSQRHDVRKTA